MKRFRNWLLFIIVVFLWGSNWAVMKNGLKMVGPLNFVMHRFLFASLILSPFLLCLRNKIPRDRNTWFSLLLLSLMNATGVVFTNIGLTYEESGISAVLTYTQPLFVFCLAVLFLREEASVRRLLGTVLGFLGVTIMSLRSTLCLPTIAYPVLFLLLGAFLWAVTTIYYKKFLSHVDPIVTNFFQLAIGMISLFIFSLFILSEAIEGIFLNMTSTYIFAVLYTSIGASAIAFSLWIFLVREEETIVVSASSFIVPIVALIFGRLFMQETIEIESILAFSLIFLGLYLVNKFW